MVVRPSRPARMTAVLTMLASMAPLKRWNWKDSSWNSSSEMSHDLRSPFGSVFPRCTCVRTGSLQQCWQNTNNMTILHNLLESESTVASQELNQYIDEFMIMQLIRPQGRSRRECISHWLSAAFQTYI